MITVPPYLKKGDTIGIVCPAGYMPFEKAQTCINTLQQWGYKVKVGKTLGHQFNYFSGTDEERLADLQQMLDDDSVNAVLCGRGGYGVSRIIDALDFRRFKKKPKWIIGYSDITLLHAHLFTKLKTASLHSPMAAAFNDGGAENEFVLSLKKVLVGKAANYSCDAHAFNRSGKAQGPLVGGNLSLLAHIVGSASDISTTGKILFIEDVGEYIYNVDRMMLQLKRAGKLAGLAGLIVGGFTDMKDTTIPFGQDAYPLILDKIKEYSYPVCFDFPVSHSNRNYALKVGVLHSLAVGKKVVLKEIV
ncbi:S66 peptidase family protein [Foetidibacter luteolus]|uniref:S66 peptidase family protein n=1 Tax=Foetidibacter luteolus TaxID=2608880 RepID=UPI00129C0611|nr:LD-carboxypeptidase [Foetidibacter luteolus]